MKKKEYDVRTLLLALANHPVWSMGIMESYEHFIGGVRNNAYVGRLEPTTMGHSAVLYKEPVYISKKSIGRICCSSLGGKVDVEAYGSVYSESYSALPSQEALVRAMHATSGCYIQQLSMGLNITDKAICLQSVFNIAGGSFYMMLTHKPGVVMHKCIRVSLRFVGKQ